MTSHMFVKGLLCFATLVKTLHLQIFNLVLFCLQAYQSSRERSLISGGHLSS